MTDNKQWMLRLTGLMLVVIMIMGYQIKAQAWQAQKQLHDSEVQAVEEYNEQIRAEQQRLARQNSSSGSQAASSDLSGGTGSGQTESSGGAATAKKYKDGSYTGSARGFGGNISVTVTVSGGRISGISVNDASGEDKAYFDMAVTLINDIISSQSPDVDAVSGATFSSNGIINAVRAALQEAGQ